MTQYVLAFAKPINNTNSVLVVLKDRPSWQRGRYNLCGGHLEETDLSPEAGAVRELKEESGIDPALNPVIMGSISGTWGYIHCVKVPVVKIEPVPREGETEKVFWANWEDIRNSTLLMPNLKVVIPLMMNGVTGWKVLDEGPVWEYPTHSFAVEFNL